MKKVIMSFFAIALFAAIFLTVSSFSFKGQKTISNVTAGSWVHFQRLPGATFSGQGAGAGTGTWIMVATYTGKAFHCVNYFTFLTGPHQGSTLIINSNCNTITNLGVWHVVSGTGDFAGAKGNGSLNMGPEVFVGTLR